MLNLQPDATDTHIQGMMTWQHLILNSAGLS